MARDGSTGANDTRPTGARADSSPEFVIARLHPHGRVMFFPSVAVIAVATGFGFALGFLGDEWMRGAATALVFLVFVFGWLLPLSVWRSKRMTITTRRVIIQRGVLRRVRSELPFTRVHDVTIRSNLVQAMFGSGDVHLGTGAERDVVMRDVPRASLVQAAVTELVDRSAGSNARQRRENARWT